MGSRYSPSHRQACTSRLPPEGRMASPRTRRILLVVAILVALLVGAVMALPLLIDADSYRETLRSQAEAALGRPVRLGTLHLRVLPRLALTADDLALEATPQEGGGDLLTARRRCELPAQPRGVPVGRCERPTPRRPRRYGWSPESGKGHCDCHYCGPTGIQETGRSSPARPARPECLRRGHGRPRPRSRCCDRSSLRPPRPRSPSGGLPSP